jgi:acetyl/propionyl-CoA carboxylase alpha subunit
VVSPHYDPLLAKLLSVGADRREAMGRLRAAVRAFEVGGVQTSLPFHRWLLEEEDFTSGAGLSTELVDRTWQPAPIVQRAALVAAELALRASLEWPPPSPVSDASAAAWWRAGIDADLESRL